MEWTWQTPRSPQGEKNTPRCHRTRQEAGGACSELKINAEKWPVLPYNALHYVLQFDLWDIGTALPGAHKLLLSWMFMFMTDDSNSDNNNTGRTTLMILSGNLIMAAVCIMQMHH